jgi:hypothetical protein
VSPKIPPRASGSKIGERATPKNGRTTRPAAPGGVSVASSIRAENSRPTMSRSQTVRPPEVERPAAYVHVPSKTPWVLQRLASGLNSRAISTMNIVVPYMSIVSPGSRTPALSASAQASIVPATTGVPSGIPVAAAPRTWTRPTTSSDHANRGKSTPGTTSAAQSAAHAAVFMS